MFNLGLYALRHVERCPAWDVAICPSRVLSLRRASWIKQALLCKQYKRFFRMLTVCYSMLRGSYLWQGTANMYRSSTQAFLGFPRDRAVKCKIDFEHARAVAIPS